MMRMLCDVSYVSRAVVQDVLLVLDLLWVVLDKSHNRTLLQLPRRDNIVRS
jgi:hypothetical protein